MLAIASQYFNRRTNPAVARVEHSDLWERSTRSLHRDEYQKMEAILDDLAARRMLSFPFSGFSAKSPMSDDQADQELYLR